MEIITVQVDEDLSDLIPGYLKKQFDDTVKMRGALAAGDYETIRVIGHGMKGTGAGYGFNEISSLGSKIEQAAEGKTEKSISSYISMLLDYLSRINVVYVPEVEDY
ncbi:MAG: Hpt domain-containing protein [Desulfobulbaceae bacterium]|nr:Hpt domain-containing protein [Desulfobulbaceae bacterium]